MVINVAELLGEGVIELSLKAASKEEAIKVLAGKLAAKDALTDAKGFLAAVLEREASQPTGIGSGVAIPHARTDAVSSIVVGLGRFPGGVDFGALDGKPATLIVMIGTPKAMLGTYLKMLARLTRLLKDAKFRQALTQAQTPGEVIAAFKEAERKTA